MNWMIVWHVLSVSILIFTIIPPLMGTVPPPWYYGISLMLIIALAFVSVKVVQPALDKS